VGHFDHGENASAAPGMGGRGTARNAGHGENAHPVEASEDELREAFLTELLRDVPEPSRVLIDRLRELLPPVDRGGECGD
jgi:hypothetical protein